MSQITHMHSRVSQRRRLISLRGEKERKRKKKKKKGQVKGAALNTAKIFGCFFCSFDFRLLSNNFSVKRTDTYRDFCEKQNHEINKNQV